MIPIPAFAKVLLGQELATDAELDEIQADADAEMDAAVEFGKAQPLPRQVRADHRRLLARAGRRPGMMTMNYGQAIAEASTSR